MTPEQERSLTYHLATVVCKFNRYDGDPQGVYTISGEWVVREFAPLTDPRDTALVMSAWRQREGSHFSLIFCGDTEYTAWTHMPPYDYMALSSSWTRAVCEAIGEASGWEAA